MRPAESDYRMIGAQGKKVGKKQGLAYLYPTFLGKIGNEARRTFFDRLTAEKTGLGRILHQTVYEFPVAVSEENLGLVLEFRIKDAGITQERIFTDLQGLNILANNLSGFKNRTSDTILSNVILPIKTS